MTYYYITVGITKKNTSISKKSIRSYNMVSDYVTGNSLNLDIIMTGTILSYWQTTNYDKIP